ncbi:MAG: alginate export family protein [Gemmataceae bacterium]
MSRFAFSLPLVLSVSTWALAEDEVPIAAEAASPAPAAAARCAACESGTDWKKIPRVRPFPRIGNLQVPPAGPGYYSLLDALRGDCLDAPPKYPYPRFGLIQPSFFDLDNFSYLDDPKNTEHDFFDPLKRVHIGEKWLFTTGGDVRLRYENHQNARLRTVDNDYTLTRVRTYGDLWYRDDFRIYAEFIGAYSTPQTLAPLPTDKNDADFLNLFVDVKVAELGGDPAYVRLGRQELLFGSQRLVSPLEWANTRRTFQGVRAFRQTEKWDFDAFWVQPVIPNVTNLDPTDHNQDFAGAWFTYRPKKGRNIDLYYLMRENTNASAALGIPTGNFTRHTIGSRYAGAEGQLLFDAEAAVQFGSQSGRDVFAGMATGGLGWNFKDAPLSPTLWAYYDFASGGGPNRGTANTFNQNFAFGHYYLGWVDQVGRQNIHDVNFHLYAYPAKWLTTWVQFHSFWLADKRDALYNAAGVPVRRDPTGNSGSHVGEELDVVLNVHVTKHMDVLTGYSYLWGGDFLKNTANANNAADAGFFFVQAGYRW